MDENRIKSFHPVATTIKLAKFSQTRIYVPESEKKSWREKKGYEEFFFLFPCLVSLMSHVIQRSLLHFSLFSFAPLESNPFTRVRWLIEREKDD